MQKIRVFVSLLFLSAFAMTAGAAVESRIEPDTLHPLRAPLAIGARVQVERIPLGRTTANLQLQRFEVWAPGAEIVLDHGDGRRERIAPPPVHYFRGTVEGDPESMVFIALRSDGALEGTITANDRRYSMRSRNDAPSKDVFVVEEDLDVDSPEDVFHCDLDELVITPATLRLTPTAKADAIAPNGTLSATGTWTLNMAIETDFELYTDLGSSSANVTTFIGNLVGQASVIYQRDLRTDLVIAFSRLQTSSADPFTIVPGATGPWNGNPNTPYTTGHALAELGDLWHNSPPYGGPRSSVVLVSGKNQTAGVAWLSTGCGGDFTCSGGNCGDPLYNGHTAGPYAYLGLGNQNTTVVPNPNNSNNGIPYGLPASNYWSLLGFSHELGHNYDGPHTHCVALTPSQKTQYGVTRNYIDECFALEGGCFSGATSVPPEKGTIMSYCHLLGSSQSRFLFGQALEPSELMANRIKNFIDSRTPASPTISAPASMSVGTSAGASISAPVGGLTYDWSIINGTINGSTTGTSINFTANVHPVTVRVRGTNASGCAASDYVNVTVISCVPPVLTSVTPSHTITLGFTTELTATASGDAPITFQWYQGTPGNTSTPVGSGSTVPVSPTESTGYWVRASNPCGTIDSGAVTVGVVPSPATGSSLYIVTPCRVIDTRGPVGPYGGPALANGATREIQITGTCGIPAGATAVVANVTAVAPTTTGLLALFPGGTGWPGNSTLNYRAGKTRANNAILVLSATGSVNILNSGAAQHFLIDVTGYLD